MQAEVLSPGPGSWMRDDSHIPGAMTPYYAALFPRSLAEGMTAGFVRYGLPVARVETAVLAGRLYIGPRVVGEPRPKEGRTPKRPPPWLIKVLTRVHPEMRRRTKTAARALETKLWRQDRDRWEREHAPYFRARCSSLQRVDPRLLDDDGLRAHISELNELFVQGNRIHFDQNLASSYPVGAWAVWTCERTGASPTEAIAVLQGSNPDSAVTIARIDAIASAVRETPGAEEILHGPGDARVRLEELRACSPAVRNAIDAYLDEHGYQIATGFDLSDAATIELPQIVLGSIARRLDPRDSDVRTRADAAASRLRDAIPADERGTYDELLTEARAAYGLHDEDVRIAHLWPMGLLRRALLAAGERLRDGGRLAATEHVFETTPQDVDALLAGSADAPSHDELARRARDRAELAAVDPPRSFGDPLEPPPFHVMPGALAQLMKGFFFYVQHMERAEVAPVSTATAVHGIPASAGRYEGTARVVHGPQDFNRIEPGDVLVAWVTSPAYNVVLPLLGAVVTDKGGALSHAAIVAREFGIPAVVGTEMATRTISDGSTVVVDGDRGIVEVGATAQASTPSAR